jgi:hypothetical protein
VLQSYFFYTDKRETVLEVRRLLTFPHFGITYSGRLNARVKHKHSDKVLYDFKYLSILCVYLLRKGKGKAIPLQAWRGPEGSKKLRLPDFMAIGK